VKDAAERPQSEVDVLKFYIWLMVVMTLAVAVLLWKFWSDVDGLQKSLQQGTTMKKTFERLEGQIQGRIGVYRGNKEDIARDAPETWFAMIWRRRGINDASMRLGAWKKPATYVAKGKYVEEQIEMNFDPKAPLPRQSIAEFCHEVEKSSTSLRVIQLEIRRTSKEDYDKDEWSGKSMIGYRHARQD
jgi:hypothetical protein